MNSTPDKLIDYKKPPVVEVVCGILFRPINSLLAPHLGLLWEKYKSEYPKCMEASPLAPIIERFEGTPEVQIEIGDKPPLPRIWFLSKSENGLIQVQRDRFLHNWRKIRSEDEYPRYHTVIENFRKHLKVFKSFLEENKLGNLELTQYEMSYVNHIPLKEGWEDIGTIGKLFPDFAFKSSDKRFLPVPEGLNWRMSFLLPDQAGRLHVVIRNGILRDRNLPMLLLELTVRGIGRLDSDERIWQWFNLARKWIVYGFADLTDMEVQKNIWKRQP